MPSMRRRRLSQLVVWELGGYEWQDEPWQKQKKQHNIYESPVLIYEVHLNFWRRAPEWAPLTYRNWRSSWCRMRRKCYTHIESQGAGGASFLWGYQITGFFAVTSRYERRRTLWFVDCRHQQGLGVIMDWVPGHFCRDGHGLRCFDGTLSL